MIPLSVAEVQPWLRICEDRSVLNPFQFVLLISVLLNAVASCLPFASVCKVLLHHKPQRIVKLQDPAEYRSTGG